jgi:hypothetical protein
VEYRAGDTIRLYLSRKYSEKGVSDLLSACGFPVLGEHTSFFPDSSFRFGINLMLLGAPARKVSHTPMPSVFISYSHSDEEFARRLYADLKAAGLRCWLDTLDMRTGELIRSTLYERIKGHEKFLVILSESALRSKWVMDEMDTAFNMEIETGDRHLVVPVRLDDAVMEAQGEIAARLRARDIADFRRRGTDADYKQAFDKLLSDLKSGA